jgi:hypothetical protein
VLEAVRVAHPGLAREPQSEQVLGRLDEDGELVAVVLAAVVETVDGRANSGAQDRAALDDLQCGHLSSPCR